MKTEIELPDVELVASKVHDAWWDAKSDNGFHAPINCTSQNKFSYNASSMKEKERFDEHNDYRLYKWCDKCHPDMYPYEQLSEQVKDYDRTTVKAVYDAIKALQP